MANTWLERQALNDEVLSWRDGWYEPYNYTTFIGTSFTLQRDGWSSPVLSWIFIVYYVFITPTLVALLIWRRNKQPIKARSSLLMIFTVVSQLVLVLSTTVRLGIGRWRYPCILYSVVFSILVPYYFIPTIFRMWRLFFIFRISQLKGNLGGKKKERKELAEVVEEIEMNSSPFDGYTQETDTDFDFNRKKSRSIAIQKFLFSNRFLVSVLVAVMIIHFLIWFFALFIPYPNQQNLKEMFAFRFTCGSDVPRSVIIGVQIIFYLCIQATFLATLYIFKIRDKWGVRLELTVSLLIISVTFAATLLLTSMGDLIYLKPEAAFPAVFYGLFGLSIDLVWSCMWPIIQSFFPKNNKQLDEEPDSLLMEVLEDENFRAVFKQYCAASLVVEPVCFYEDNCEFADPSNMSNKRLIREAKQMIEKYCRDNSPLLLNLPNKDKMLEPIESKIKEYEARLIHEAQNKSNDTPQERWVDPNLFIRINNVCLSDMNNDTFVRFRLDSAYETYLKEKQKLVKQQQQFGI